jgi:acetylornithine deacetylase/succinyl-diaminopimelate desuccinylase family protein
MSDALFAELDAEVERETPYLVALLQKLVRIQSVNPKFERAEGLNQESEVQDAIEAELAGLGFATSRSFPLPGRPNLYGRWDGAAERTLALCGHVDVVPVGDRDGWTKSPFGAEIEGDVLYGRGSGDMKAGLVASLMACRAIKRLGLELEGGLEFHSVVDEEAGGFGAMEAAARRPAPRAVLVAESTAGSLRPWAGGLDWVRVIARGRNGHSSRRFASIYPSEAARLIPVKSVNAIELGARVLASVRELEMHWAVTKAFPGMPPGMNTISPGAIFAGAGIDADGLPVVTNNPGIVPDTCAIDFDLKFLPHEKTDEVRRDFEAWIARFAASDPWLALNPPKVVWNLAGLHFPPVNTATDDPLCMAVADSVRDLGEEPRFEGMLGVTDAAHYAKHGISTIVYGPAGANAHAPDESVSIASTVRAARVIAATIVRYCGVKM